MFEIDGTIIILSISFIIFSFIMQHVFYSPMSQISEERNKYIDTNKTSARLNNEKAEEIRQKKANRLAKARKEASEHLNKQTSDANAKKSLDIANAIAESREKVTKTKEDLDNQIDEAKAKLKSEVANLAASISHKILGTQVPLSGISDEVIEKALKEDL